MWWAVWGMGAGCLLRLCGIFQLYTFYLFLPLAARPYAPCTACIWYIQLQTQTYWPAASGFKQAKRAGLGWVFYHFGGECDGSYDTTCIGQRRFGANGFHFFRAVYQSGSWGKKPRCLALWAEGGVGLVGWHQPRLTTIRFCSLAGLRQPVWRLHAYVGSHMQQRYGGFV